MAAKYTGLAQFPVRHLPAHSRQYQQNNFVARCEMNNNLSATCRNLVQFAANLIIDFSAVPIGNN
jgi:hypothetical protein